jgi:hypothetical protein
MVRHEPFKQVMPRRGSQNNPLKRMTGNILGF